MQKFKCFDCATTFTEADREWDVAINTGRCPKCFETLRNFPVPVKQQNFSPDITTSIPTPDKSQAPNSSTSTQTTNFCPNCGVKTIALTKFCSSCGYAINGKDSPADQISVIPSQATPVHTGVAASSLGTKWLKFWNYFSLPVGGVLGLLMSLGVPALGIIMVPISILQFVVAYGLHHRRLWAWQCNWVLIIITYISIAIPTPTPGVYTGEADLVVQFVIKAVLGGLIWMWPNHVYWKKRRTLFS